MLLRLAVDCRQLGERCLKRVCDGYVHLYEREKGERPCIRADEPLLSTNSWHFGSFYKVGLDTKGKMCGGGVEDIYSMSSKCN
jgi:hypothetical protein